VSLPDPPRWTTEEFDEQRELARQVFRSQRLNESQGVYSESFSECLRYVARSASVAVAWETMGWTQHWPCWL